METMEASEAMEDTGSSGNNAKCWGTNKMGTFLASFGVQLTHDFLEWDASCCQCDHLFVWHTGRGTGLCTIQREPHGSLSRMNKGGIEPISLFWHKHTQTNSAPFTQHCHWEGYLIKESWGDEPSSLHLSTSSFPLPAFHFQPFSSHQNP